MRRRPCSKCGISCSSTWRSEQSSRPITCSSCSSKQVTNYGGDRKSRLRSSVSRFDPIIDVPVMFHSQHEEMSTVVPVAAAGDAQSSVRLQDQFRPLQSKQKNARGETLEEPKPPHWFNNVKRKKRSKLPQYAVSPTQRLIYQLQDISMLQDVNSSGAYDDQDDVLVYGNKCKMIGDNEIGLGAMLLSSTTATDPSSTSSTNDREYEGDDEDGGSYLFDVPIRGPLDF